MCWIRQVADARPLAGSFTEPPRRGAGTRPAFSRAVLLALPQKDAIEHNIGRALQLADKSAYHYYVDFAEKGYYNRLISGNINQVVHVDSVVCDFAAYPYKARTYARQLIIRESNVTERSLVTSCSLQNTGRSDDNPNGFIIEQFTILENRDIRSVER